MELKEYEICSRELLRLTKNNKPSLSSASQASVQSDQN